MAIQKLSDLLASGLVLKFRTKKVKDLTDSKGLSESDLKSMFDQYVCESINNATMDDIEKLKFESGYKTLCYEDFDFDISVAWFLNLKDKFEDSTFTYDKDKEFIENLVGRISGEGEDIKLGSNVRHGMSIGRVIWVNSGFYLYNDMEDYIETELGTDSYLSLIS